MRILKGRQLTFIKPLGQGMYEYFIVGTQFDKVLLAKLI